MSLPSFWLLVLTVLVGLRLQNIALIDKLELAFEKGFTVLTGETGAGKSILLDALDILLGGGQSSVGMRFLRNGSKACQIEATFLVSSSVKSWLTNNDFDVEEDELFICREWRLKDDRISSRCRLNGIVINKQQLCDLRPLLIDLTAQGQAHYLSSSSNQLCYLDRFGGPNLQKALCNVKRSWKTWRESAVALNMAEVKWNQLQKESKNLKQCMDDLDSAHLDDPSEEQNLKIDEERLVNAVRLQEGIAKLLFSLQEGTDQLPSLIDQLGVCIQELQIISELDPSLGVSLKKLLGLQETLQEVNAEIEQYGSFLESDSSRLVEVQERLALLKRLQRSYNLDLSQLICRRDEIRDSLTVDGSDDFLKKLAMDEILARKDRDYNNNILTNFRRSLAIDLEKKMMKYLRPLGLSNACFKVQLNKSEPRENGVDSISFLFSANPGQSLKPLIEVASGGEMSRCMLALKTLLSQVDDSSTLIFDEIDSGVSGRVSRAIASTLKELSTKRQVFCVTHQPLVAAVADHHFCVRKVVENGDTRSEVCSLQDDASRRKELAELAGGDFDEARAYAASLLDKKAA